MRGIIIFCIFIVVFVAIFVFATRKYNEPWKLYMVFGRKGSGKSTYMAKLAYKYHKRGFQIFSNTDIPYSTKIDISLLGKIVPPPKSVLMVDEVGMIWDNRDFKNFRTDVRDYFKYQRHYRNIVYLFSQTFDIDVKLRTLTDAMYLVTKPLPVLSVVRKIQRKIVLVQPDANAEGRISDSLAFVPWYLNLFGAGALQLTWLPKWCKTFDSHWIPPTPQFVPRDFDYEKKHDK